MNLPDRYRNGGVQCACPGASTEPSAVAPGQTQTYAVLVTLTRRYCAVTRSPVFTRKLNFRGPGL